MSILNDVTATTACPYCSSIQERLFGIHEGTKCQEALRVGDSLLWEFNLLAPPATPSGRWHADGVAYCDACDHSFGGDVQFDSLVYLGVDNVRRQLYPDVGG
jgi:hypothetical protein